MSVINNNIHYLSWGESPVKETPTTADRIKRVSTVAFQILALNLVTSGITLCILKAFAIITLPYSAVIALAVGAATIALCLKRQLVHPVKIDTNEVCSPNDLKEIPLDSTKKTFKADLVVYNCGHESWQMKKRLIRSATQSIECSFNFAGGAILKEFLSICEKQMKAHPDLKIHLMLEDICSDKQDLELLKRLQKEYPERFFYLVAQKQASPISLVGTEENHAKLLIVDGKYFMIGSSGTASNYCDAPLNAHADPKAYQAVVPAARHDDTDIAGESKEDKIAFKMRYEFFRLYSIWRKRLNQAARNGEGRYFKVDPQGAHCPGFSLHAGIHKNARVNFLVSGPEHRGHNPIEKTYVNMIKAAKKTINIANLAFYLTQPLKDALTQNQKARKIGYFEGGGSGKFTMSYLSKEAISTQNRMDYDLLDEVHEWTHPLSLFHRKVMVCDANSIVGSYNLGIKSSQYDYECALTIVDNPDVAATLKGHLKKNPNLRPKARSNAHAGADILSTMYRNLVSPVMG